KERPRARPAAHILRLRRRPRLGRHGHRQLLGAQRRRDAVPARSAGVLVSRTRSPLPKSGWVGGAGKARRRGIVGAIPRRSNAASVVETPPNLVTDFGFGTLAAGRELLERRAGAHYLQGAEEDLFPDLDQLVPARREHVSQQPELQRLRPHADEARARRLGVHLWM